MKLFIITDAFLLVADGESELSDAVSAQEPSSVVRIVVSSDFGNEKTSEWALRNGAWGLVDPPVRSLAHLHFHRQALSTGGRAHLQAVPAGILALLKTWQAFATIQ